jgi:hypothetical protein
VLRFSSRRWCDGLFSLDLPQTQDRLDSRDLALGLDDLAGSLEALGFTLETKPEQVVLNLLEQELELFVSLITEFGGFGHDRSPVKR